MANVEEAIKIYNFIWQYATEHDELPSLHLLMSELDYSPVQVLDCIDVLREAKYISPTTLKPTAYDAWRNENVQNPTGF
jgi:hypothetical protein